MSNTTPALVIVIMRYYSTSLGAYNEQEAKKCWTRRNASKTAGVIINDLVKYDWWEPTNKKDLMCRYKISLTKGWSNKPNKNIQQKWSTC